MPSGDIGVRPRDSSFAEAGPELIQLLTPEGERVEHPDYSIDLSAEELRAIYRDLALVRRVDVEATALQRQGELGIWASLLGQEGAQIGAGWALESEDMAFPTYRSTASHGAARSIRWTSSASSAAATTVPGIRLRRDSTSTRSSSARSACTQWVTRWACSATARRVRRWRSSVTGRPVRAT